MLGNSSTRVTRNQKCVKHVIGLKIRLGIPVVPYITATKVDLNRPLHNLHDCHSVYSAQTHTEPTGFTDPNACRENLWPRFEPAKPEIRQTRHRSKNKTENPGLTTTNADCKRSLTITVLRRSSCQTGMPVCLTNNSRC